MNKENEKVKYKTYTREKEAQAKGFNYPNNQSNYSKQFTFDKYKIHINKLKHIRKKSEKKNKISSTVNNSHLSPLQKPFPVKKRQNSQMITEFPSINKRKSQTPSPMTKQAKPTKYLYTSPNKPICIKKKYKPSGNFMRVNLNAAAAYNGNSFSNVKSNYASAEYYPQIKYIKKHYTPNCNSPKANNDFKLNNNNSNTNIKKPFSALSPLSPHNKKNQNDNKRITEALNFKTKIYQLTQTIQQLKIENKEKIKSKDEEIDVLTQIINNKSFNSNDNSHSNNHDNTIIHKQEKTINSLEVKLKDTQNELAECKILIMKQKELIEDLTGQLSTQQDIEKQANTLSKESNKDKCINGTTHSIIGEIKNDKIVLFTQEQTKEISFLLRKLFEVNKLSLETVVYNLFENDTTISFDKVVSKLLSLLSIKAEQNQDILLNYFISLSYETDQSNNSLELMKTKFIENMTELKLIYTKEFEQNLTNDLIQSLFSHQETLENKFKEKDQNGTGLILHETLKAILSEMCLRLSVDNYEQLIYTMKQFDDCNYDIYDLNYSNVIFLLKNHKANEYDDSDSVHYNSNTNNKEEEIDYNNKARTLINQIFETVLASKIKLK